MGLLDRSPAAVVRASHDRINSGRHSRKRIHSDQFNNGTRLIVRVNPYAARTFVRQSQEMILATQLVLRDQF